MGTDQEKVEKSAEKPAEKETEMKNDSIRQDYTFASDVVLKECKYCRVMIPKKAKVCPNCKMVLKSYTFLKAAAAILVLAVIVAGVAVGVKAKAVRSAEAATAAETVKQEEVKVAINNKEEQTEGLKLAVESDSAKENAANDKIAVENKAAAEDKAAVEDKSSVEDKSDSGEKEATEDKSDAEENGDMTDQTDAEKKDVTEEKSDTEDESTIKEKNTTEDSEQEDDDKPAMVLREIDENEAAFRADCVQRKYKSLLRDEEYLETAVLVMEAEVVCQADGGLFDENVYYLCMVEENGNDCYYIVRDDRETDETLILEGDIITVYGRLFGTCKVPARLIETRPTVPAISMLSYDLLEE